MNFSRIENSFQVTSDAKCVRAAEGIISAGHPLAAKAGALMLENGGNAVDAAAAAALCLGVCEPQASGIGGQSMALVHLNKRSFFLDGVGKIPALADVDQMSAMDTEHGYKATSVPTTLAVLQYMVHQYGNLSWQEIVAPSIEAAFQGYHITKLQNRLLTRSIHLFLKVPSQSGAHYFLKHGSTAYQAGELFRQPELGTLLQKVSEQGVEAFYQGEIAERIDEDMRENGGFLRKEDLARIPWPKERPALKGSYRGIQLATAPPPGAGRSLLILLKLFEQNPSSYWSGSSPHAAWDKARIIQTVLAERRANPIHPDSYAQDQDRTLNDPSGLAENFRFLHTPGDGGGETTHISTMDKVGNAVGVTQSINLVYGSKAAARDLGFLYNDYLVDCNTTHPDHPNYLRSGGSPASFVSPVIAFHQRRPWLVAGSPGSERIISCVGQFFSNVIDAELPICAAMRLPRLHLSPENILSLEAGRMNQDLVNYLDAKSSLSRRNDFSFFLGALHAVMRCTSLEEFQGVAEIRRDGTVVGI